MKTPSGLSKITLACAAVAAVISSPFCREAAAMRTTALSSPGVVIPDDNLNGVADSIIVGTPITSITDLQVTLDISGGYGGDFYAYLRHTDASGTGFAVLLNRVGDSAANPYGSAGSGIDATFSDSAATEIHSAGSGGGALTGIFQPDARNVSPFTALNTSPRTAFLDSFEGMNPNGTWTIFIADVSPVGEGTLEHWGLTIDGSTPTIGVPDGGDTLTLFLGACAVLQLARGYQTRLFSLSFLSTA